jgi:serine/threonine-protein kinase
MATDEESRLAPSTPTAAAPRSDDDDAQPASLPQPPGVSRVDTLPDGFSKLLSRRSLSIGDVIADRYKLQQSLGYGGMGQVFVAENLAIGRRVAIKVLKPELLADAHFRTRFQYEAQAIASIEHRNVARFLDLVVGDPTFLVMEYVVGPTLAEALTKEKRFDVARAVHLATRLCWGLDAVHRAGVVHRDLKPANVILAADAELGEEPKIIDFGLAKLAHTSAEHQITRSGQIVGTPHYMSPEQVENRDIDPRADVYSLGCLLYHMLAGRPPFQGDDDLAVLFQQVRNTPEPLARYVPDVPPELDLVVQRALAKEPRKRFRSTTVMAEQLAQFDKKQPPLNVHETTGEVTLPHPSRVWRWLAPVAALALGSAALGAWRLSRPAAPGPLLIVGSRPAGATVELDGQLQDERTPALLRHVAPGPHRLRITRAGSAPEEQVVTVQAGERSIVDFSLSPLTRSIELLTVPAGALVFVDDRLEPGETPLRVEVTDGDFHKLRIEKPGFVALQHALKPEDTQRLLSFHLEAEREPRGVLWVDSNHAARVFIDGLDSGLIAPTVGMIVGVGQHRVELRDSSGTPVASSTVKIEQGGNLHVSLDACGVPGPKGAR